MTATGANNRICKKGHHYFKTSDCPVCPICERERKPQSGLLSVLSAPARRALENQGIETTQDLAKYSKKEILTLHGIGPGSIPKLVEELKKHNLSFKSD
jgi:predicted RecB family nuclease